MNKRIWISNRGTPSKYGFLPDDFVLDPRAPPPRLPLWPNLGAFWFAFVVMVPLLTGIVLTGGSAVFRVRRLLAEPEGDWLGALTMVLVVFVLLEIVRIMVRPWLRSRTVFFEPDGVRIRQPLRRQVAIPYAAFAGVRYLEKFRYAGWGTEHVDIVELVHENPRFSVPVLVQSGASSARERMEFYARYYSLPAIETHGPGWFRRGSGELDASIADIVRAGRPATATDGDPPAGIEVLDRNGDTPEVVIRFTPSWPFR